MDSKVCMLYADDKPSRMPNGDICLLPNQRYRNPTLALRTKTLPPLAPTNIRVKMEYAGLCGTDLHLIGVNKETGYILNSAPLTIPKEGRIIGHEGVGRIIELGENVEYLDKGDYVTFESILSCKNCPTCRKGNFNQCINSKLLGMEVDGIFGNTIDIAADLAHNVNNLVEKENGILAAACIEPASVAYVACENSRICGGDKVVIFGAGPIGLYSALLANNIFGASDVYIIEPITYRRQWAQKYFENVYEPGELSGKLKGIDVIIETSGCLENINNYFYNLNPNSRIVLLARTGVPLLINAIDHMITNSIMIIGSRGHLGGAFDKVIRLQISKKIDLNIAVTQVVDGIGNLVDYLQQNKDKVYNENCKVLFKL